MRAITRVIEGKSLESSQPQTGFGTRTQTSIVQSGQEASASSELEGLVINGKACKYFKPEMHESHKIDRLKDEFYAKYKKILPKTKAAPISEENSMFAFSQANSRFNVSQKSFVWDEEQFIRHYSERLGEDFTFVNRTKKSTDDDWEMLKRYDRQVWV